MRTESGANSQAAALETLVSSILIDKRQIAGWHAHRFWQDGPKSSSDIFKIIRILWITTSYTMFYSAKFHPLPSLLQAVTTCLCLNQASAQSGWAWNEPLCDYTTDYRLVMEDDFNGTTLDQSKWVTWFPYSSDGSDQCASCRNKGDDNQVWLDEQVIVDHGILRLRARKEATTWYGNTEAYRSGMIHSREPYVFNEGKFEIRCKVPGTSPAGAMGAWIGFWLFGGPGHNEIDAMEICGSETNIAEAFLHNTIHRVEGDFEPLNTDNWDESVNGLTDDHMGQVSARWTNTIDNFHTYTVEWLDDWIIFYMDGDETWRHCKYNDIGMVDDCTLNGPWTSDIFVADDVQLSVIADHGLGAPGAFCGGPDPNNPPGYESDWEIDYIRVWQNEGHFEPGLSNLCNGTFGWIQSSDDAFCTVGEEIDFQLLGTHGDPITWWLEDGQGLQIIESDDQHCKIRCNIAYDGCDPILHANDPENPCQPGIEFSKHLYLGIPTVQVLPFGPDDVVNCPQWGGNQYWCIEPNIHGFKPIFPAPLFGFTTYYPPGPYNPYDPVNPGTPPTYWPSYAISRPYQVFVDGEEQSRYFAADYEHWYSPYGYEDGHSCGYAPLECQEHWWQWGGAGPGGATQYSFCLMKEGDFCNEVRVVAQNGCGTGEQTVIITDHCVLGPCDVADPDLPALLPSLISVTPVPASTEFTIHIDQQLPMSMIDEISVKDAVMNAKATLSHPTNSSNTINCSDWPQGIYYITVRLTTGVQTLKVEIR